MIMKRFIITLLTLLILGSIWAQTGFDIAAFSDTTKYGWADYNGRMEYRNDFLERQKLLQLYEMDAQTVRSNMIKSAIVPGWGQFSAKQPVKGEIFLGAEIVTVGTALLYYDRAMTFFRKYETATQVDEIEDNYKKAQGSYQYSIIFAGLGFVVWAYNLYDVVTATGEYNSQVWKNIMKKYYKSPVQLTPDGVEVRF